RPDARARPPAPRPARARGAAGGGGRRPDAAPREGARPDQGRGGEGGGRGGPRARPGARARRGGPPRAGHAGRPPGRPDAGVRLVSVVGWCGLAPGDRFLSVETWDMHGNAGIGIFGNGWNGLGWALPCCDQAVSALLEDLELRGLLESTLVVLVGEFGRTP